MKKLLRSHVVEVDISAKVSKLVKRDVNWNPSVVLGTGFGAFCDWYLCFGCPKHAHGRARYRPDPVCLSGFVPAVSDPFLMIFMKNSTTISRKIH